MNKQLKHGALALGLTLGGIAIGQGLDFGPSSDAEDKSQTDFVLEATALIRDYRTATARANGAPQVSQVANEATAQLLYINAKQNAEIIRLLTEIKNKK
jgi:hypothetical protein